MYKSMLTMFCILEHSGMCHLFVSLVFVIQLIGISITSFVLFIDGLFQLSFVSNAHAIVSRVLDDKGVYSHVNISIMI